ncbi:MAG: SPOR domain-containing protein, partial [Candidatus Binatia bacterium]
SYSAARALDLVGPGTARVRVERLDDGREAGSHVLYAAQAAAFLDGGRALALKDSLAREFDGVYVSPYRAPASFYYRVRLGPFPRRDMALANAQRLDRMGLRAIIVEEVAR